MVQLIISEKPDASKNIAHALADKKPIEKKDSGVKYYELSHKGKDIIVASAVGHLYNLGEVNKKGWDYPVYDIEWKPAYQISDSSGYIRKYIDTLSKLIPKSDEFVNACDWDSEGELIFELIRRFLINKKAKRMYYRTLTKSDLIESYNNMSAETDHMLAEAGETRHYLDHYWGISSSRALTLAVKHAGTFKILSSGRVQSPMLALLAHREKEINDFKPAPFWQILANLEISLELLHENDKLWDEKEAGLIYSRCSSAKTAKLADLSLKRHELKPPAPFNITSLQTESYRLFRFSPKQTLDIAQSLYLMAFISYPRTSSEKLDPRINYSAILKAVSKLKEFSKHANLLIGRKSIKPVEGKKTDSAHIAIYPTNSPPKDMSKLNDMQKKLYSLIVRRFLALFAEPAVRETVEAAFAITSEQFKAKGIRTVSSGWLDFYGAFSNVKEKELPKLEKGKEYSLLSVDLKKDETKPPGRYSQGSIISEMEKHNLGTRATRSGILQTLYDRHYIEDKSVKVTKLGMKVADVLEKNVPELVSEDLTREFETEMEKIQAGKGHMDDVLKKAKNVLTKIMNDFRKKEKNIGKELAEAYLITRDEANIIGECSLCHNNLRITYSKKNKSYFIGCSGYPGCTNTFSLPFGKPQSTGKACASCNFPLVKMIRKGSRPYEYCISKECPKKKEWYEAQLAKTGSANPGNPAV